MNETEAFIMTNAAAEKTKQLKSKEAAVICQSLKKAYPKVADRIIKKIRAKAFLSDNEKCLIFMSLVETNSDIAKEIFVKFHKDYPKETN